MSSVNGSRRRSMQTFHHADYTSILHKESLKCFAFVFPARAFRNLVGHHQRACENAFPAGRGPSIVGFPSFPAATHCPPPPHYSAPRVWSHKNPETSYIFIIEDDPFDERVTACYISHFCLVIGAFSSSI